uniref:hypothetical protein n=1 Tax=Sphingomonas montana TaxID=1843236 RepID=UPI0019D08595
MRLGLALFGCLALAACSERRGADALENTQVSKDLVDTSPAPSQPVEPVITRAPLGGQPLTSSVSGLSGAVTGFDVRRTDTQTIVD